MKTTHCFQTLSLFGVLPVIAALALATGFANAQLVSNFSNFSKSGDLLPSPNTRQQTFTPSGTRLYGCGWHQPTRLPLI